MYTDSVSPKFLLSTPPCHGPVICSGITYLLFECYRKLTLEKLWQLHIKVLVLMRICSGEILWQKTLWMSCCVHYGLYELSEYSSARSLRVCSPFLFYCDFFKQVDWKLLGDYGYHVHTMTLAFIDILPWIHYLLAFDLQFGFPKLSFSFTWTFYREALLRCINPQHLLADSPLLCL